MPNVNSLTQKPSYAYQTETLASGFTRPSNQPPTRKQPLTDSFDDKMGFNTLFLSLFLTFLCYCPKELLGVCTTSSLIYRSDRLPLLASTLDARDMYLLHTSPIVVAWNVDTSITLGKEHSCIWLFILLVDGKSSLDRYNAGCCCVVRIRSDCKLFLELLRYHTLLLLSWFIRLNQLFDSIETTF